jgi:hypothetical protein
MNDLFNEMTRLHSLFSPHPILGIEYTTEEVEEVNSHTSQLPSQSTPLDPNSKGNSMNGHINENKNQPEHHNFGGRIYEDVEMIEELEDEGVSIFYTVKI